MQNTCILCHSICRTPVYCVTPYAETCIRVLCHSICITPVWLPCHMQNTCILCHSICRTPVYCVTPYAEHLDACHAICRTPVYCVIPYAEHLCIVSLHMHNTCILCHSICRTPGCLPRHMHNTCILCHSLCRTPVYCVTPYAEHLYIVSLHIQNIGPRYLRRYSNLLQAEGSGDRIPVEKRFSAPVQTGPEAHPASCTMGTGSFPGVKRSGRCFYHPPHLALRLKESRAISLIPLWAFVPCYRVNCTFTYMQNTCIVWHP